MPKKGKGVGSSSAATFGSRPRRGVHDEAEVLYQLHERENRPIQGIMEQIYRTRQRIDELTESMGATQDLMERRYYARERSLYVSHLRQLEMEASRLEEAFRERFPPTEALGDTTTNNPIAFAQELPIVPGHRPFNHRLFPHGRRVQPITEDNYDPNIVNATLNPFMLSEATPIQDQPIENEMDENQINHQIYLLNADNEGMFGTGMLTKPKVASPKNVYLGNSKLKIYRKVF